MENTLSEKLLPVLPLWVATPLIIISTIGAVLPSVIQTIRDFRAGDIRQKLEKGRLEILQLRYQIEAFRKDKGLEEIDYDPEYSQGKQSIVGARLEDRPLSAAQRFFYTFCGATITSVFLICLQLYSNNILNRHSFDLTVGLVIGFLLRLVVLGLMAGLIGLLLLPRQSPRWSAALIGISVALFIPLLIEYLLIQSVGPTFSG